MIQKIYKKLINEGYNAEIRFCVNGIKEISVSVYDENGTYQNTLSGDLLKFTKNADVSIEYRQYHFIIMRRIDAEYIKEYNKNQKNLLDTFWNALHNGKSQKDAKALQYDYAVKNNCINIYNAIYGI